MHITVDGNGIIFVCLHPLRLPRRVRVCKQRPPSSLSHFCFFGRVAERGGRIDCWRCRLSCYVAFAISVHKALLLPSFIWLLVKELFWQPLFCLPAWWFYHVSRSGVVSVLRAALSSRWQRHHLRLLASTSSAPAGAGMQTATSLLALPLLVLWQSGGTGRED